MDHLHERKQEQIEELTLSSRWFRDGWKVTNWPVLSISVFCFQYWGQHDHHHHHHHHYHHDHHHHQWWFTSTTITITLLRAEEKKTWPMTILVDIWCLPMVTNIWNKTETSVNHCSTQLLHGKVSRNRDVVYLFPFMRNSGNFLNILTWL